MAQLIRMLEYFEPIACAFVLVVLFRAGQLKVYRYLAALVATRMVSDVLMLCILQMTLFKLNGHIAYVSYFFSYWGSYAVEALLGLGMIVSIYKLAMAPLPGLQRLGMMMFRWAGGISIAIAFTIAIGPRVDATSFIIRAVSQLQQTQSVLTLCMLLFVCMAIQPMGLSYRSRIFGVSLGLGIIATADLVIAAWLPHMPEMNSVFGLGSSLAICMTLLTWSIYFLVPEPARRMIVLPTTSPFLRWNQISQVLGDEPGFVALGEVSLDMFAPAEVEVMRRASGKMNSAASF